MSNKPLTHEELQQIEHINKVLEGHRELVKTVCNETEKMLDTYLPIITNYVHSVADLQQHFGRVVSEIVKSTREMKVVTSGSNEIHQYVAGILKLAEMMKDPQVQKVIELAAMVQKDKQ